jgi:hypothetical protein
MVTILLLLLLLLLLLRRLLAAARLPSTTAAAPILHIKRFRTRIHILNSSSSTTAAITTALWRGNVPHPQRHRHCELVRDLALAFHLSLGVLHLSRDDTDKKIQDEKRDRAHKEDEIDRREHAAGREHAVHTVLCKKTRVSF